MKEVIERNGGRVYNDKMATNIAYFMILPINYECDTDSRAKTKVHK